MGRKQFTTLILRVTVPQPPGKTQREVLDWIDLALKQPTSPFASFNRQVQVKITGKESTYL